MARTTDAVEQLLAGVDLFAGLSASELRRIREAGKELEFGPGDELTVEGRQGGRFFLILDGEADVSVGDQHRRTLGRGDYLGEIAVIDGEPRSASVVATTPVRTWSLASFAFRPILREHPSVAEQVMLLLCRRLRAAEAGE